MTDLGPSLNIKVKKEIARHVLLIVLCVLFFCFSFFLDQLKQNMDRIDPEKFSRALDRIEKIASSKEGMSDLEEYRLDAFAQKFLEYRVETDRPVTRINDEELMKRFGIRLESVERMTFKLVRVSSIVFLWLALLLYPVYLVLRLVGWAIGVLRS